LALAADDRPVAEPGTLAAAVRLGATSAAALAPVVVDYRLLAPVKY
jgi:hypothetical protein